MVVFDIVFVSMNAKTREVKPRSDLSRIKVLKQIFVFLIVICVPSLFGYKKFAFYLQHSLQTEM